MLYQALAIEHPRVKFSYVFPATVQGDFRASAVDGGPIREAAPNKHGLEPSYVAGRLIKAVDHGERTVYLPWWYVHLGHLLYWIVPSFVEYFASKKYRFTPP